MKFITIFLLLVSAACTQKAPLTESSPVNSPSPQSKGFLTLDLAPSTINLELIGSTLTGQLTTLENEINFDEIYLNAKVSKRINLFAKSDIPTLDISSFQNASTFTFKSSNCPSSLLKNRSCVIDIEFIPSSLGLISESLNLNSSLSFNLVATVLPEITSSSTEQTNNLVVTSNVVLDDFTGKKKVKRASILNLNSIPVEIQISETSLASGFSYTSYCPSGTAKLEPKRLCQVEVTYDSLVKENSDVVKNSSFKVNDIKDLSFSITHKATIQSESTDFVWVNSSISFGATNSTKKQMVYLTNNTGNDLNNLSFNSLPSGLEITRTNCLNSLKSNFRCYAEVQITHSQILDGAFNFELAYSNSDLTAKLPISAVISGGMPNTYPCSLSDVAANGWNTNNVLTFSGTKTGSDVSLCNVDTCSDNYFISNKACVPIACNLSNANIANAATVSGDLINGCVVESCVNNYTKEDNQCKFLATVSIISGNNQSQPYGSLLSSPLVAEVKTPAGIPMTGVAVSWSVESGNGTLSNSINTTNAQGQASTSYTLGPQPGNNTVKISVTNTLVSGSFSASGVTTPFTHTWGFDSSDSLSYSYPSSIEYSSGKVRLTAISQNDSANTTSGFASASLYGVAWDESRSQIRLNSSNSCNGSLTNCEELHSRWTPNYNNLVGYWKLNNSLIDSISNNSAIANATAPTYTSNTRMGTHSANFTGGTSALNLGDLAALNNASAFTISGWFLQNTLDVNGGMFAKIIDDTKMIRARTWTDGNLYSYVYNGATATYGYFDYSLYVKAGTWFHYTMVFNGSGSGNSNRLKVYINGEEIPLTYNLTIPASTANLAGANLELAENSSFFSSPSVSLNGRIDDFAVWNSPLSASVIKSIYARQAPRFAGSLVSRVIDTENPNSPWTNFSWTTPIPFLKGLPDNSAGLQSETSTYYSDVSVNLMNGNVALYHLDEASGSSTVVDKSSGGKNGSVSAGITLAQEGKIHLGAKSNGSTGYISLGTSSAFRQNSQLTVSAWVKGSGHLMGAGANGGHGYGGFFVGTDGTFSFAWTPTNPISDRTFTCALKGNPSEWTHYAMTISYSGAAILCYINGQQSTGTITGASGNSIVTWAPTASFNSGLNDSIGGRYLNNVWYSFTGSFDEVSLWNRILSSNEIRQVYRRAANRIKFQVRSCATENCSGVAWKGPDNTSNTYFSEIYNVTSQSITPGGLIGITTPLISYSNFSNLVSPNRYFQYQAVFESDDEGSLCTYGSGSVPCSPELKSVTTDSTTKYSAITPAIVNNNPVSFYTLNAFSQTLGSLGCSSGVGYNISLDKNTWYWWNGSSWSIVTNPLTQNNSSSEISSNLGTIPTQIGTGQFYFKSFLKSNGTNQCELDQVQIGGEQ